MLPPERICWRRCGQSSRAAIEIVQGRPDFPRIDGAQVRRVFCSTELVSHGQVRSAAHAYFARTPRLLITPRDRSNHGLLVCSTARCCHLNRSRHGHQGCRSASIAVLTPVRWIRAFETSPSQTRRRCPVRPSHDNNASDQKKKPTETTWKYLTLTQTNAMIHESRKQVSTEPRL